jgi:protein Mpv17
VLGGIADTVAQTLTAVRVKNAKSNARKDDFLNIRIADLDKKDSAAHEMMSSTKSLPPPFDFERLTRFMAYGFIMSPLQFHWFGFLSRAFPLTKQAATVAALKRVGCDQLMFAPFGMLAFQHAVQVLTK